jgi:membrane-associated phospholipid phosphatase
MILGPPGSNTRMIRVVGLSLGALLLLFIVFQRFLFLPKMLMVGLVLLVAFLAGRIKPLVRDWFVFMAFLYLFDSLRGAIYIVTCKLQLPVRALYVLDIEKALFGTVPSVALQNALLRPDPLGTFTWFEKVLTVCYGSHFIAFLLVGFIIWLSRPAEFALFRNSFYWLIFVGVSIYALVPTVPPWMAASQFGLMPALTRFNAILFNFAIPDLSSGFDTNPIAAMPSLHAGFPILCSLLLWRLYRWKAAPFYVYTLAVLFAIVYSGDHYVTDILAGAILAVAFYVVAVKRLARRPSFADRDAAAETAGPAGGPALRKQLLVGLAVLLAGVALGGVNKTQFGLRANSYNMDVPRYVDFFRHQDRYEASFPVQLYFGNHFMAKKDYATAIRFFEKSLALARGPIEAQDVRMKVKFCRQAMGQKS